ncbi:MAG: hypothetical protein AMXMBFR8_03960 [Nevskiales bacterium]
MGAGVRSLPENLPGDAARHKSACDKPAVARRDRRDPAVILAAMDVTEFEAFWARCREVVPAGSRAARYTVRRMGNAPAISETLLRLVTTGQKTGVFSRPQDLEATGGMPRAGDYVIFTDHSGRPRCLVQIEECRSLKFCDVGSDLTACESPAAQDVEVWRGIHRRYWTPVLAAEGKSFDDEMPIVFQRFRLVRAED